MEPLLQAAQKKIIEKNIDIIMQVMTGWGVSDTKIDKLVLDEISKHYLSPVISARFWCNGGRNGPEK